MLLPFSVFSQMAVYNDVKKAKENGRQFKEISVFKFLSSDLRTEKVDPEVLQEGILLKINTKALTDILQNQPEFVTLIIPVSPTSNIKVDLLKHQIFAEGFFVSENKEPNSPISYKGGVHYKGVIQNDQSSIVAFSFFENEIVAMISNRHGNKVIGKIQDDNTDTHILYNDNDLQVPNPFECSTEDDGRSYPPNQLQRNGGNTTSSLGDCINIYIEIDNDVVIDKGGAVNATNYVTGLFNQSFVLYANETLSMAITQILCWTTTSPYASITTTSALLSAYQANTGTFNGDLSHLITYKGGGGQAAGFSGICNSNVDESKCVSKIYSTYSNVPTYSWPVNVVTHEMGHLIGSRHTHACVWNGNSTAIDGCSGATEGGCALPGNPAGGGTIMSYCHLQGVGMNFSLGFGPQPGNVIRNTVLNAACLDVCGFTSCSDGFMNGTETGIDCGGGSCPTCPVTCNTPTGVNVTSIGVTYATINWTAVVGAVTYTLEYKLNSSGTWIVASSTISNTNSYYLAGLTSASLYDYRIKTNCSGGSSTYFQGQFTTITPAACNSNYEPNETRLTGATIPANTVISATIGSASDLDYYKLTTAVTSDIVVTLSSLPDDYDLEMYNPAGTSIGLSENGGTTTETISLTSLAAGTYYFFVYGYGGANSNIDCYDLNVAVTATAGCIAPTGLAASSITGTTATISWGGVGSALTYNVEYKLNSSGTWIVASSTHATTSYNLTGLTAGLLYDYRIRSNCASGNSAYTQAQFTTSPACVTAYEPNETLATAVPVSENTTVSAGINTSTDIDYFKVTTTGVVNFLVTLTNLPLDYDIQMYNAGGTLLGSSANGGTTSESITLNNQPAGTYVFRIFGYQGVFNTSSCYNLFVGTTPVVTCATPGTLTTSLITNTTATFNWAAVSGATSYNVQYRIVGAPSWTTGTAATNSFPATGLTALSNYEWQVQTVCASGTSSFTASTLFSTLCTTPTVTITAGCPTTFCTGGNVLLTANPSIAVTGYQWSLNGGTIAGATASTFTANATGNYTVQVTSGTCSSTSSITAVLVVGLPTVTSFLPGAGIVGSSVVITGTNFVNVTSVKFNGVNSVSYTVNSATQITATVPVGATNGFINVTTNCGNVNSPSQFTVITNFSLQVKAFIEGYYIGSSTMRAVANPTSFPGVCDTIEVQLANSTAPYAIAHTVKGTLTISGVGTFLFPLSVAGNSYYVVVKHRNALQTWSAAPVSLTSTFGSYDFSTAANKAYGSNQVVFPDLKTALYSGDVNQDNVINNTDFTIINSNLNPVQVGYISSDLTGDRCVESADFSLLENRSAGISISKP